MQLYTKMEQAGLCKPANMQGPKCRTTVAVSDVSACVSESEKAANGHVPIRPRSIKRIVPPRPLWKTMEAINIWPPILKSNRNEQHVSRIDPPQPFEDCNKNISQVSCLVVEEPAHHEDDNHAVIKDNMPGTPVSSSTRIEESNIRELDYEKNESGKSEDLMLFDATEEVLPPHVIQKGVKTEKVLKSVAVQTETELSISVDLINEYPIIMGFVGVIESLWISTKFEAGSTLTIVITEVYDPVTFWFTIFDEEHFGKMHLLMDDMGLFYEKTQMKYFIPKHKITKNMLCAVYYNARWQRIMTISPVEKDKLKVLFIDYGAIEIVDMADIRYLPQCFRTLPRQAIRGRMDFIKPPNDEKFWPIEFTKEFIRRIQEKNIIAKITRVDEEDNVVWIEGRVENDDEDISINERFAKNGLAQYSKSIIEPKNLDYLLPSFHQLETGVATSFIELTLLPRDDVCDIMAENIEKYKALENGSTSNINDVVENEPNPTQETEFERDTTKSSLGDLVRIYVIANRELHCFIYKSALHVMTEEFLSKFIPIYSIYGLKVKLLELGEMICLHECLSLKDDEDLFRALQRCDAGVPITDRTVIHLTPLRALDVILFTMKMESLAVLRDVKAIVKEVFG